MAKHAFLSRAGLVGVQISGFVITLAAIAYGASLRQSTPVRAEVDACGSDAAVVGAFGLST